MPLGTYPTSCYVQLGLITDSYAPDAIAIAIFVFDQWTCLFGSVLAYNPLRALTASSSCLTLESQLWLLMLTLHCNNPFCLRVKGSLAAL